MAGFRLAIDWITKQRVPDGRHVHTDLMCPSCFKPALNERRILERFDQPVMGYSPFPVARIDDRDFLAVLRRARKGRIDTAAGWIRESVRYGKILAINAVGGELFCEAFVRPVSLGNYQESGGVLVDPVHDAGASNATNAGKTSIAMMQQCIDERAVVIACCWMDNKAGRLVHDKKMIIFEHKGKGNILCFGSRWPRQRYLEGKRGTSSRL